MTHICEVTYNWPAEVFAQRHVETLAASGQNVTLVARHSSATYSEAASVQEGRSLPARVMPNFDHLSTWGKLASLRHLLAAPHLIFAGGLLRERTLLAYFRRLRPDLIHFHTANLAAGMAWIPEALGVPYTVSLRGSDIQVEPLRSPEARQAIDRALCGAAGIHATCDALGRKAPAGAPPVTTIYTTLPLPQALPARSTAGRGRLALLAAGRIHWTKAYPDLLVAMRGLLDSGVDARLTLVGSGPDRPRVEFWAGRLGLQERLHWAGKASFSEIQALLLRADAFVQSSIAEGFSNSTAEALAWGCPVFATQVGGTAEIIQDGITGFLLPPRQPESWVEKLKLALDRELMETIREQAYQLARQHFAERVHSERFAAFYRQALAGAGRQSRPAAQRPDAERGAPAPSSPPAGGYLLVWGPWQWGHGADLVVSALGAMPRGSIACCLVGCGPQEDELRYLVDFHNLGEWMQVFKIAEGQLQDRAMQPVWFEPAQVVLDLSEAEVWHLRGRDSRQVSLPAGDVLALRDHLCAMLDQPGAQIPGA